MAEPRMLKAIHPFEKKQITPKEFASEFGANYKENNIFPTCIHCGEKVFTYGTSSINVTSRFKHFNDRSCDPSPIGGGNHPGFDLIFGEKIKEEFCRTDAIIKAYVLCLNIVGKGNFPVSTFINLCRKADKKNIWSYIGVELWMIPYMLLTLDDFSVTSHNNNTFNIRFVLDKTFNLLLQERNCNIEKIYTDSQNLIRSFPVSSNNYQQVEINWIKQSLRDKITSFCS